MPPPLPWIDLSKWDGVPVPRRKWAIRDRVPLNQAGLFSGEGGTGKSIIEITKNVAHVTGKDWLGSMPEPGPAFYLGAEDDVDELHIRIAAIAAHYGTTFKELTEGGLHVLCLLGQDATLCAPTRERQGRDDRPLQAGLRGSRRHQAEEYLDRYAVARLRRQRNRPASGLRLRLAHAGACNGGGRLRDRPEPSQPAGHGVWQRHLRLDRVAWRIPVPAIPQRRQGRATASSRTAICASSNSRKTNMGRSAKQSCCAIATGLFLPEAGMSNLDKISREAKADDIFIDLLKRLSGEGRNVADKPHSPTYAPTAFAKEAEAKQNQLRKPDLEAAMRRQFASGKIHVETYGRPSRPYSRLAIK